VDDIQKRIEGLQRRHAEVQQRKANAAGALQARKDELAQIVQEIKEAGYDPKQITQIRDQVQADLIREVEKLEAALSEVESSLNGFPAVK
jgi:uncharacterized protein YoxC